MDNKNGRLLAPNSIEKILSGIESRIAPLYNDFIGCCDDNDVDSAVFHHGRLTISAFAAHLLVRHPLYLTMERRDVSQQAEELKASLILSESEIKLLEDNDWRCDFDALVELATMAILFSSSDRNIPQIKIYESFVSKHFIILKAPAFTHFVTTSAPIMVIGKDPFDYSFDCAFIPLSRNYAAYFYGGISDSMGITPKDDWLARWNSWLLWSGAVNREILALNYEWLIRWNRWLLLNCPSWDVAMSSAGAPLRKVVSDWKISIDAGNMLA